MTDQPPFVIVFVTDAELRPSVEVSELVEISGSWIVRRILYLRQILYKYLGYILSELFCSVSGGPIPSSFRSPLKSKLLCKTTEGTGGRITEDIVGPLVSGVGHVRA